ncbi:hypothetical protein CRYUN_Cryun25bG0043700 [Craigia yunnanensis]
MKIGNIVSALHAKLFAISFGLKIAWDNSFPSIMVESDSLLAIQEVTKHQEPFCEWGSLISDIMELSSNFQIFSFHHIKSC